MPAPATLGFTSSRRGDDLAPESRPVRAPDLAELETLVVCAAEGSLVAAAERLGVSRPAVTKRIANLEALAGRTLLNRGGRGVRLTDAGATLLGGARRMLDERDVLLDLLTEIRGAGPSPIAGLRGLLGHSSASSRAAQQPEACLAETERVLEFVLGASATAVVISDPETAIVHEVNHAFCRFTGRSRAELVGRTTQSWCDKLDREGLLEQVRRAGVAERIGVRVRQPDGSVRVGELTAHSIVLAGTRQLLSTVEDITPQHNLKAERAAVAAAHGALGHLAAQLLAGRPAIESIGAILPELRRSGEFATALVWDAGHRRPVFVDGDRPSPELDRGLLSAKPISTDGVVRLGPLRPGGVTVAGWATPLADGEHSVVLLCGDSPTGFSQGVFADVLAGLARLVAAGGSPGRA